MSEVVFKIYSGLHLGAAVELHDGTWVIGSDDSADIVLADTGIESRHVAFVVENATVTQSPLDGALYDPTGENALPETIEAGKLFRLGSILVAWGPKEAGLDFWQAVERELASYLRPQIKETATNSVHEESDGHKVEDERVPSGADVSVKAATDHENASDSLEESLVKDDDKEEGNEKLSPVIKGGLVAALLIALMLPVTSDSVDSTLSGLFLKTDDTPSFYTRIYHCDVAEKARSFFEAVGINHGLTGPEPSALVEFLRNEGYPHLSVERAPSGAYLWKGTVADDSSRSSLLSLAKRVPWPVVLDVTVLSDITDAYRSAFNTLGYWPELQLIDKDGVRELIVSGYFATALLEERAFDDIASTLPVDHLFSASDKVRVVRKIRYRGDLEPVFNQILNDSGLEHVTAAFSDGKLTLRTVLTSRQKDRLERAVAAFTQRIDVPVKIDIESAGTEAVDSAMKAGGLAPDDSMTPAFRVKAVSGGTLRFVALANGDKVFVGGILPGGFKLLAVESDKLILQKNNQRIVYPLRMKK